MTKKTAMPERNVENGRSDVAFLRRHVGKSDKAENSPQGLSSLQSKLGNRGVQILFKSGFIQAKLKIGEPNDVYEREADRVAEQVMRMPDAAIGNQQSAFSKEEGSIQRKPG